MDGLRERGHEVLAAVLVGGTEKLPAGGIDAYGDVPVRVGSDARSEVARALDDLRPDAVMDLSDEPVLDYRRRLELVSIVLHRGVPYEGADFLFHPPPRPRLATSPSLAIIGTGKRTGKTAISGFAARTLSASGLHPVVLAMGRGGPEEPEVLRGDEVSLVPSDLLAMVEQGKHAASDYIEDALLARVPTVGCRRCGGGLAGGVEVSNVAAGVEAANGIGGDLLILEGSGSAIPPVHADATCLVVPASIPEEFISGYLGLYRLLLADFVVVTMCEEPFGSPSKVSSLTSLIENAWRSTGSEGDKREIPVVRTVFRPGPTRSVEGATVFVATTAPAAAGPSIKAHLEEAHRCVVAGITHALSDRAQLEKDLSNMGGADHLLCEIKAAGIDVATKRALDAGMDVVYMDNVPQVVGGTALEDAFVGAASEARQRFEKDSR